MKNAKLLLFEDSPAACDDVRFLLRNTNHEIVGEAKTRKRAFELIDLHPILGGKLLYNVVLLDANLGTGTNGVDAHAIWYRVQRLETKPTIIGISTNSLRERYGIWISEALDLTKDRLGLLPQLLDSLPENQA